MTLWQWLLSLFAPPTVAVPAPPPPPPAPAPAPSAPPTDTAIALRAAFLGMVNGQRAKAGVPNLVLDVRCNQAATSHAQDMARMGVMTHTGSNGSTVGTRLLAVGLRWSACAENVAEGQPTVEGVFEAWMNSPPHRANILSPDVTVCGLGWAPATPPYEGFYWCATFARPA
jgi:uncharacterized protein YkwD